MYLTKVTAELENLMSISQSFDQKWERRTIVNNWFIWFFYKIQAEFEARKAKEKVSNLDGENEVSFF